jgi:hypothetical protein
VLGCRADAPAVAGRRPALPHQRPGAGVPGVLAEPVRRAGRQRQQGGQPRPEPVGHRHGDVPVGDPDVHLGAADQLFPGQQLVVVEHPLVPVGRGDRERLRVDQRDRPGGDQAEVESVCDVDGRPAQPHQVPAQLIEAGTDRGVGLHHGPVQLGGVAVPRQPPQDLRAPGDQLPGVAVDDVQLLLDAEGQGRWHRGGGGRRCHGDGCRRWRLWGGCQFQGLRHGTPSCVEIDRYNSVREMCRADFLPVNSGGWFPLRGGVRPLSGTHSRRCGRVAGGVGGGSGQ